MSPPGIRQHSPRERTDLPRCTRSCRLFGHGDRRQRTTSGPQPARDDGAPDRPGRSRGLERSTRVTRAWRPALGTPDSRRGSGIRAPHRRPSPNRGRSGSVRRRAPKGPRRSGGSVRGADGIAPQQLRGPAGTRGAGRTVSVRVKRSFVTWPSSTSGRGSLLSIGGFPSHRTGFDQRRERSRPVGRRLPTAGDG
jgi:hypothetical protein